MPTNSAAQLLKAFLASPRDRGEVIYLYHSLVKPYVPPGAKTTANLERASAIKAKWQPGAYYFMTLDDPSHARLPNRTNIVAMGGQMGVESWWYSAGVLRKYELNPSPAAKDDLASQ